MATRASARTLPAAAEGSSRSLVASFPPAIAQNPYQRLLYEQLARHGFPSAPAPRLKLGWLWRNRRSVRLLHFHWPQGYYAHRSGTALSLLRVMLFAARLSAARALGYRVVWTVHQLYPHERNSPLVDRLGTRALAASASLLIAHDQATADDVRRELGATVEIVPHASYVGVYPQGSPREEVRAELGLAPDAFAFLCFGHVRGYKELGLLLEAFAQVPGERLALVVAGLPLDEAAAALVRDAAARDARIKALLEFIPDERVAELHGACDAAVVSRTDGGTSGALVLALSLGLPVVAFPAPAYAALIGDETGWLVERSLGETLVTAAADPDVEAKGRAAKRIAETFSWPVVGERTAELLREAAA